MLRVGVIQQRYLEPFETLREQAEALVERAVAAGASIVVLPEFPLRRWFAAEIGRPEAIDPTPGSVARWAAGLARRHRCHVHCVDLERDGDRWYNTARLQGPHGTVLAHRKRRLPDEPGFRETAWYSPGAGDGKVAHAAGARVAALTCSDVMFVESARVLGRQGCDVLLVARASVAGPSAVERWAVMLRANAIASGAYVVSANRIGVEGAVTFAGHSLVVAPSGEIEVDMGVDPGLAVVDLDLDAARRAKHAYPVLIDRDDWV